MNREQLIKQLSPEDLTKSVYMSQALFLIIAIMLYFLFIRDWSVIKQLFHIVPHDIFFYGFLFGSALVVIEIILYQFIPKRFVDDGGVNEKLFKHHSVLSIILIALVVAIVEELLFRAIIQTVFGYIFASSLFVIVHTRYLRKPILLIMLIGTSFLIGYLFELTNSAVVTMTFHFVVDCCLGLYIKFNK